MKKNLMKLLCVCVICNCIYSIPTFAATQRGEGLSSVDEVSSLLPESQTTSGSIPKSSSRGVAMALCILNISNAGGGKIGVAAHTVLHKDIEWGIITIYLDRWNEADQSWDFLKEYEYEFPTGNLGSASIDACFDITDQPSGYYYRLRGVHEIEYKGVNNKTEWEGLTTSTNGVFITDTP